MSNKQKPAKSSQEVSLIRSSAAEYLTFVAARGTDGVEAVYADENVWLSQKMMALLYDADVRTVNYHLKKVFSDSELEENSVIRNFRITAADGAVCCRCAGCAREANARRSACRRPPESPRR